MSISPLGSLTNGATVRRLVPSSGGTAFGAQITLAVGQGHAGHGTRSQRVQETGTQATQPDAGVSATPAAAPPRTLADDTRALVGDVFGALGAGTPSSATAQRAIAAYRRAG